MADLFVSFVAYDRTWFFVKVMYCHIAFIKNVFLTCSLVTGRLGCLFLLAIVNTIAMYKDMQIFLQDTSLSFFGLVSPNKLMSLMVIIFIIFSG